MSTQAQIIEEIKLSEAGLVVPAEFDWDYAIMNSEGNATQSPNEEFLDVLKATLEMYVDQQVHEF